MIDNAVILGMDAHALADGYAAGWLDPVDVARDAKAAMDSSELGRHYQLSSGSKVQKS